MGITQYRLDKEIDVPAQRTSEIVAGKRTITADTDLRLCRFFGLSSGYWLRDQVAHDTEVAERELDRCYGRLGRGLSLRPNKAVQRAPLTAIVRRSRWWEPRSNRLTSTFGTHGLALLHALRNAT
ncbi:MAG: HigA family addiction module antitoxin [Chloracidobacterium sp.]